MAAPALGPGVIPGPGYIEEMTMVVDFISGAALG